MAKDLVCNMEVDEKTAKYKTIYQGKYYYFWLQDAKNPSKQTPKNISVATRQVKVAVVVTTNAKPLRFNLWVLLFVSLFSDKSKFIISLLRDREAGERMNEVTYRPIGVVNSPFKEPKNVPIQASASKGTKGSIEVNPKYAEGLKDLEDFSHIILLYHFSLVKACSLLVKPFVDDKLHGVFATRSPARTKYNWHIHCAPNPNRKKHTIHSRCRHFKRHPTIGH